MPERYTYLLVDFCCILFPFLFSFHPKIRFHQQWRFFLLPCLLTAAVFIGWDIVFTRMGVWSFNPRYVLGVYVSGLPIEELLFFLCIPYACVFTYFCFVKFFRFGSNSYLVRKFAALIIAGLLIMAALFPERLYTTVTFFALAFWLIGVLFSKPNLLPAFFATYLVILVPFFFSNGTLTGMFTDEAVVIYNPAHNLGWRIVTIPFEDIFYGMLLFLMNVSGFEYLRSRVRA